MSLQEDVGIHLPGLERLRLIQSRGLRSPYAGLLDMRLVDADDGRVVVESAVVESVMNTSGTAHGGFIASLVDSACGLATMSKMPPHHRATTLELKISYHKAVTRETGPIRAEGVVVSVGRRVAFAEARLEDAAGRVLASASSTLLVMKAE